MGHGQGEQFFASTCTNNDNLSLCKLADSLQCLRGSMSRQHQGELMQFTRIHFTDIFDLVEATHEGAVCRHLSGQIKVEILSQLGAAAPVILLSRLHFRGNYCASLVALFKLAKRCCQGGLFADIESCLTDECLQRPGPSTQREKSRLPCPERGLHEEKAKDRQH